jgi:hypothetical protein
MAGGGFGQEIARYIMLDYIVTWNKLNVPEENGANNK